MNTKYNKVRINSKICSGMTDGFTDEQRVPASLMAKFFLSPTKYYLAVNEKYK